MKMAPKMKHAKRERLSIRLIPDYMELRIISLKEDN
jgi:hypothetical protein